MKTHLFTLSLLQCLVAYSAAIDTDADGLDDLVETGTGIFVSQSNVGTSSTQRDSDGDGVPDGLEVFEKTNPNSAASFNAFSIGLAGYYPLNGSGFDLSANSNSATNYAASAAADRFADDGAALFLNGVDNTVETTDSDLFRNLGTHATISFWCNPQSQNRGVYLISKSRWAGQQWAVTYGYNGADSLQLFTTEGMNTPGFFSPPVSVQASRWTHCAIVVEGNQCRIFLNGTLAGTSVITVGLPPVSGLPVRFSGATDPVGSLVSPFKGLLDDVRIYNRPLPASELRSLYRFEIQDRDGDGIRDLYETGTGVFVSPQTPTETAFRTARRSPFINPIRTQKTATEMDSRTSSRFRRASIQRWRQAPRRHFPLS
jgi:hypothetical protein